MQMPNCEIGLMNARGGKRPGAGRKAKYPALGNTKQVNFWLPQGLSEFVDEQARAAGLTRSEWLTRRLLRSYRRSRKSR